MLKISKTLISLLIVITCLLIPLTGCNGQSTPETSSGSTINSTPVTSPSQTISSTTPDVNSPSPNSSPILAVSSPISTINSSPSPAPSPSLTPVQEPAALEIIHNAQTRVQNLTTLKLDMDLTMAFATTGGEHPFNFSLQEKGTGNLDAENQQMAMKMDFAMDMPEMGNQKMYSDIYIVDGWMYMQPDIPGTSQPWTKMQLTEEMWALQSRITDITEFLPSATQAQLLGNEIIKGVDCQIFEITPDLESLLNWANQQMQSGQPGSANLNNLDLSALSNNLDFSVKTWISKKDTLLMQQQISLFFKINPEDFGMDSTSGRFDSMTMEIDGTFTYYDYGQPVIILLPPEALDATEISTEEE